MINDDVKLIQFCASKHVGFGLRAGFPVGPFIKKLIMENIAPFKVGDKAVALEGGPHDYIHKGEIYIIKECIKACLCGFWIVDIGLGNHDYEKGCRCPKCGAIINTRTRYMLARFFAPINPYSNSLSKQLAEEAVKERVEVDGPVKEVVNN